MEDGGLEELKMMLIKADSDRNSLMELLLDERKPAAQKRNEDKGLEELKMRSKARRMFKGFVRTLLNAPRDDITVNLIKS